MAVPAAIPAPTPASRKSRELELDDTFVPELFPIPVRPVDEFLTVIEKWVDEVPPTESVTFKLTTILPADSNTTVTLGPYPGPNPGKLQSNEYGGVPPTAWAETFRGRPVRTEVVFGDADADTGEFTTIKSDVELEPPPESLTQTVGT